MPRTQFAFAVALGALIACGRTDAPPNTDPTVVSTASARSGGAQAEAWQPVAEDATVDSVRVAVLPDLLARIEGKGTRPRAPASYCLAYGTADGLLEPPESVVRRAAEVAGRIVVAISGCVRADSLGGAYLLRETRERASLLALSRGVRIEGDSAHFGFRHGSGGWDGAVYACTATRGPTGWRVVRCDQTGIA